MTSSPSASCWDWLIGRASRYASSSCSFSSQCRPCPQFVLQHKFACVRTLQYRHLAVTYISQVFEIFDREMIPFHKKNSCHQPVRDKYAHTSKVRLLKAPPKRIVEAGYTIISIGSAFPVWNAIKEVPILGSLFPHPCHLLLAGLEVSKVLFS